ncbi:MAG: GNAT family N-acetyltransferase [Opitutae bacterium]
MSSPLRFRRAEVQDAALLTEIALAGKRHWGYPDDWMAQWRFDLTVAPAYLHHELVVVAELEGAVVGFAGLSELEGSRYLEHLWLRPGMIGRGFGRAIFEEIVRQARAENITELQIKSDPNAAPFYLKMGAVCQGSEVYWLLGKFRREVPLLAYSVRQAATSLVNSLP